MPCRANMTAQRIRSVVLPRFLLDGHRQELDSASRNRVQLIAGDDPVLLESTLDTLEVIVTGIEAGLFGRAIEGPRSGGFTASRPASSTSPSPGWPSGASC